MENFTRNEIERQIKELCKDEVSDYIFDQKQFVDCYGFPLKSKVEYLYKKNKNNKCWLVKLDELGGIPVITFDKKTVYFLPKDRDKLSKEQQGIFCMENPFWAKLF